MDEATSGRALLVGFAVGLGILALFVVVGLLSTPVLLSVWLIVGIIVACLGVYPGGEPAGACIVFAMHVAMPFYWGGLIASDYVGEHSTNQA